MTTDPDFRAVLEQGLQKTARRFILYGPLTEHIPVTECSLTQSRSYFFSLKSFVIDTKAQKNFANPTW